MVKWLLAISDVGGDGLGDASCLLLPLSATCLQCAKALGGHKSSLAVEHHTSEALLVGFDAARIIQRWKAGL